MATPLSGPPSSSNGNQDSLPSVEDTPNGKIWRVGTLTYTTAGLMVLFCWLLWGDFAWSMRDRSVGIVAQILFKEYKATDMVFSFFMGTLPAGIGLFLGPFISYRSDRLRSPEGRRIPYLKITTPIIAISIAGMGFGPMLGTWLHGVLGESSPGLNFCVLGFLGFFWTVFEFATLAAIPVFMALINDVVPAAVIGRFFAAFRILSLMAGYMFNKYLIGDAKDTFFWIFVGVGILYGVGFATMILKVKEGTYPPPPPPDAGPMAAVSSYMKQSFSNRYYWFVFIGLMLGTQCFLPINFYSIPYAKSISMDMKEYGAWLANCYLVSIALAYPLGALVDRIHPLRVGMVVLAAYAALTLAGGFFVDDTRSFLIFFVAHTVVSGIFFTTTASLPQRMFPRLTFAQFNSAAGVILAVSGMFLPLVMGGYFDLIKGDKEYPNYQHTFYMSGGLAILALVFFAIIHAGWMKRGGPKGYVAPEG